MGDTRTETLWKIDGMLFKFKKDEEHHYGSWEHTCFFCDKILDVLNEILQSQIIKNNPVPRF